MASPNISRLFRNFEQRPTPVKMEVTAGEVPKWLYGVFLRVGPGLYDLYDKEYTVNHWFDGFALMHNFVFVHGQVIYRCRYLQSESLRKAIEHHKTIYTEFGTKGHPDLDKSLISRFVSNFVIPELTDNNVLNVFKIQDSVYTATETHFIHSVDPVTLQTNERIDLNKHFSSHMVTSQPLTDSDGTVYNMATSYTAFKYQILKFPPADALAYNDSKNASCHGSVLCQLPFRWNMKYGYNHSFSMTTNYIVFIEQPLLVNGMKLLSSQLRGLSFYDCMEWVPEEKNRFFVIEKKTGAVWKTKFVASTPHFAMNHINAYEDDGHIVVDLITYPDIIIIEKLFLEKLRGTYEPPSLPQAQRFVLPMVKKIKEVKDRKGDNLVKLKGCKATAKLSDEAIVIEPENLGPPGFELPQINEALRGKKYKYVYGTGLIFEGAYRSSLVKLNVQTHEYKICREDDEMTFSEPTFVPHPQPEKEDDGLILTIGLSFSDETPDSLRIFNAKNLLEIARLEMRGIPIPPLYRGRYFSFVSDEESKSRLLNQLTNTS